MTSQEAPPIEERSGRLVGLGILLIVTAIWGTTFPLVKDLTAQMTGVELLFLRFAVEDSGIGIAQADQEKIFTPFAVSYTHLTLPTSDLV